MRRAIISAWVLSIVMAPGTGSAANPPPQRGPAETSDEPTEQTAVAPPSPGGSSGRELQSPDGRLRITATRATSGVVVDGALDDEVWEIAQPVGGFLQSDPQAGEPASEPTEVWVAYDSGTLYIAAYCHDSEREALVLNDIREDFVPGSQDSFEVVFDTFADRRNGFVFMTNPAGARSDQQSANEGREINTSWDAVWTVQTRLVRDGWTLEMAIPFKSLRFEQDGEVWGINFSRRIRRLNEVTYWSLVPRQFQLHRVSLAGDLVGLPQSNPGRNLRIKPYVAAKTLRETGGGSFNEDADFGVDLKYGLTPSLTLDVTGNPDFAQVEADEQQVNLTQFSQFFPEKRDFFLENSGIFFVSDVQRSRIGNRATSGALRDTDLLPFFSRRIGLTEGGREIPITAGGRVTGQVAGLSIGALTVQTRDTETEPNNNFSVVRARKNISDRADFGGIFLMRQSTDDRDDYNRVWGLDTNVRLFRNFDWAGSFLKTTTPGLGDGQYSFRTSYLYEGTLFYSRGGLLQIGENFTNDLAFFQRIGIRKWTQDVGLRPRPKALGRVGLRELQPHANMSYYTDLSGRMVAKRIHKAFSFHANNGSSLEFAHNGRFEEITAPFTIHPTSEPIPPGRYGWGEWWVRYNTDPSRMFSGSLNYIAGGLWSGTHRTVNAELEVQASYRFRATLGVSRTSAKLDIPRIDFVTSISTLRTNYSFTTNMFLDALVQYDRARDRLNSNVRFNLIHHPLSDLFIVYNEQRFVDDPFTMPGRSVIVKFTQMMAF